MRRNIKLKHTHLREMSCEHIFTRIWGRAADSSYMPMVTIRRSQKPRVLRGVFAAGRLLDCNFRIPPVKWVSVFWRDVCRQVEVSASTWTITRPEESYRVCCVRVWSWSLDNEKALVNQGLLRYGGWIFCFWRNSPPVGQGLLIHEVSISHTTTHHSR